jgi:hypothetical protein
MANTTPTGQRPAAKDATPPATSPAKPVATFRYAGVSAAIFADQAESKAGDTFTRYSVTVRRSYKNAAGQWAHTHTFRGSDILVASHALRECYEWIAGGPDLPEPPERE